MENLNDPATKGDLVALEERMVERIEMMETRLLTEFHRWSQTYEVRVRGVSSAVAQFDDRLGIIEERVSALERVIRERPQ